MSKVASSTSVPIATSTESAAETKRSIDLASEAERRHEMFQRELIQQNEKHIVAFITAICFAVAAYIGYDYLSLPSLWSQLVIWRLLDILCGIAVIALFLRKRISALTAWAICFIFNALHLGCFASLYHDPIQFLAANINLSAAMFILPLALLTYPLRLSIGLTVIFVGSYLFWYFQNSSFSFSELMIYGGTFQVFAIVVSVFGHWSKLRSIKRVAELNLIIESKNQEILGQNHKLELQATYDALTSAFNRGPGRLATQQLTRR